MRKFATCLVCGVYLLTTLNRTFQYMECAEARHASRKATPGDPSELRGCPTKSETFPNSCPKVAERLLAEILLKVGQQLCQFGQHWSMFVRFRSTLAELGRILADVGPLLSTSGQLRPHVVRFGRIWAELGQVLPTFCQLAASLAEFMFVATFGLDRLKCGSVRSNVVECGRALTTLVEPGQSLANFGQNTGFRSSCSAIVGRLLGKPQMSLGSRGAAAQECVASIFVRNFREA